MDVMTQRGILSVRLLTSVLWLLGPWGYAESTAAGERSKASLLISIQEETLTRADYSSSFRRGLNGTRTPDAADHSVAASVAVEEVSLDFHSLPLAQGIRRLCKTRIISCYTPHLPRQAAVAAHRRSARSACLHKQEAHPCARGRW